MVLNIQDIRDATYLKSGHSEIQILTVISIRALDVMGI